MAEMERLRLFDVMEAERLVARLLDQASLTKLGDDTTGLLRQAAETIRKLLLTNQEE